MTDVSYRDKYRHALEEQERLERQFRYQLEALKKTLFTLSGVAQGIDKSLDVSLASLKEKIRGASGQAVMEQLERVQKAALDAEHSRHTTAVNSAKQVGGMLRQLGELNVPTSLRRSLDSFEKGLSQRLDQHRIVPDVLEELRKMQELALGAASNPDLSLWQRMKGGRTLQKSDRDGQAGPAELVSSKQSALEAGAEQTFEPVDMDLSPKEGELITADIRDEGTTVELDPGDEDDYQKVAQRISRTLENLVERIEPNEMVKHKIDIVRLRIQRGMDWYVLAVTLEDIRDILLLRYLQNDEEFSDYLKRVNQELKNISEALGLAVEVEDAQRQSGEQFSSAVSEQVDKMRNEMAKSKNIDQLKVAVSDHLSTIQGALKDYRQAQQQLPSDSSQQSLTEQLKALINKVENIEGESERTKKLLEEERHRATHDPLTELPNREAYNERAFQELQRFQRYSRPLTLAVCDIDHFKKINDNYGHQVGDKVLKLIAKLIATRLRKVDFIARYGGEEFVILMPETTPEQAKTVLDKVRSVVAKTPFKFKGEPVSITMCFGIAGFAKDDMVEDAFERADHVLYDAKRAGRNRCLIADAPEQDNKEKK